MVTAAAAFALGLAFLALFAWVVAEERRERDEAIAAVLADFSAPLPFEPPRGDNTDSGTTHLSGLCSDGASAPKRPATGSLSDRLAARELTA